MVVLHSMYVLSGFMVCVLMYVFRVKGTMKSIIEIDKNTLINKKISRNGCNRCNYTVLNGVLFLGLFLDLNKQLEIWCTLSGISTG